jgi:hypothetical protein
MRGNFARAWHLLRMQEVIQVAEWGKVELPIVLTTRRQRRVYNGKLLPRSENALVLRGQDLYAQIEEGRAARAARPS